MAGKKEVNAAIQVLKATSDALLVGVSELISEMVAAFSRLLAKIAAGSPDLQEEVDLINAISAKLNEDKEKVDSAIAQAKVEGQ